MYNLTTMSKEIINKSDHTTCPNCGHSGCTRYRETGAGLLGNTLAYTGGAVAGLFGGLLGPHAGHMAAHSTVHAIQEGMSSTKIYCKCKSCGHKWQVG